MKGSFNETTKLQDIIIKEAGKGRSVVIMGAKHYYKMIYDHLNDNQIYNKTDSTCDNKVMNKIKKRTIKYQNILTTLEIDYLANL